MSRPTDGRATWSTRLDLALLLIIYLAFALVALTRYPTPWVDEGWIAEVAAQAAHGLPLGNPSHGALYRYADRVFWMPHLQFELLGAWFRAAGVSLTAGRLFSVALGGATALLLFLFLRRHGTRSAAWLGVALFVTDTFAWKALRTIRFEPTLTLLYVALALALDSALARDAATEHDAAIQRGAARRAGAPWRWLLAGLLLAALCNVHPNAALLALGAGAFVLARGGWRVLATRGPWLAAALALLGALPFALYVRGDAGAHFANLAGQNSFHFGAHGHSGIAPLDEWHRYADYFPWPARAPLALGWLLILGWGVRHAARPAVRGPLVLAVVPLLGLALLPNKSLLYLVPELPFVAALGAAWLSDGPAAGAAHRPWWRRPALLVAALILAGNLVVDAALLRRNADQRPERAFAALRAQLRPDDRVAGTFVTWWAAQPLPFREFHRVQDLADLQAFRPTVVLLGDRHWEEARGTKFREIAAPVEAWVREAGQLSATITDPGLGAVRVYRIAPGPGPR